MKTRNLIRLALLASIIFWMIMVFADFNVLFSDLRKVRPDIPRILPNIMLDLFTASLFYFYRFRIEKDERLDFNDLLWKVFAAGLITTIISLGTRLIVLSTGRSAIGSNVLFNYLVYQINFSLFLSFLMAAFITWKRLITYQKDKWVVRTWNVFQIVLLLGLLHDSLGIRLNSVLILLVGILLALMILTLSVSMKWVAYLNFKQKLSALLLTLLIVFYLVYFGFTVTGLSNNILAISPAFLHFDVHVFNLAITIFATVYAAFAFLVILFNLPTSSAFEQKLEEALQYQRLSQSIQTGQDEESVYPILLESSVKSLKADAAWLEIRQDGGRILHSYGMEASAAEGIISRLAKAGVSLVPDSGNQKKVNLAKFINTEENSFRSLLVNVIQVKGESFGLLAVLREMPDGFTPDMSRQLAILANQAGISIENFRLIEQVVQNERYKEELKIARKVKQSLLPARLEQCTGLELAAFSESSDEVGGDYYDTLRLNEHQIAAIIADVSGKGTTAAFHMSQMKGIFHSLAQVTPAPVEFLSKANSALAYCLERGSFISAVYFVVDSDKQTISYARAGHCPLLLYRAAAGKSSYLDDKGAALGMIRNKSFDGWVHTQVVELQKNDVLLLYTDGITEARNRQGEEFGYDRLRLALDSVAPVRDAGEIRQGIMKHLYLFTGGIDVNDDHTMLVIRSGNNPSTDKPVSNISLKTINP